MLLDDISNKPNSLLEAPGLSLLPVTKNSGLPVEGYELRWQLSWWGREKVYGPLAGP